MLWLLNNDEFKINLEFEGVIKTGGFCASDADVAFC
jgi:hypothetical protein